MILIRSSKIPRSAKDPFDAIILLPWLPAINHFDVMAAPVPQKGLKKF
jgi:hypothetical protein